MVREVACGRALARRRAAFCVLLASMVLSFVPVKDRAHAQGTAHPVAVPAAVPPTMAPPPGNRTRFIIGLSKPSKFQVLYLPNPHRVVVDLPSVKVQLPAPLTSGPVGLVKGFVSGLTAPGRTRVVIEVAEPVIVDRAEVVAGSAGAPHQLVLEIVGSSAHLSTLFLAANAPEGRVPAAGMSRAGLGTIQPPLPKPAERPEKRAARAYKPLIVLDPGHGGHDSGAVNNGTIEKDVVLAFAKVLRAQLGATGRYRVEMTRDTDVFVPLDDRRSFAEERKAALFIAIHADYASTSARGATIYSLREEVAADLKASASSESREERLSSQEEALLRPLGRDAGVVKGILADLVGRETEATRDRTGTFVRSVIEYMGRSTSMRETPDRTAAFRVLQTAKIPAVLIELAYVTNHADAALLRSDQWRQKVATSIRTAIDNYFTHQSARLPL